MKDSTAIRPKLKHNSVLLQTEDGIFVQGDEGGFRIKGKSIARWLSALSPYLNGEYTLDQLCSRLEPAQREQVVRIVEMLLQRGIAKNTLPEAEGILPPSVQHRFRCQLDYIDHFVDFPQAKFKAFREHSILLSGSGESLRALALFLLRNGLRRVCLAIGDEPGTYLDEMEAEARAIRQEGCEVEVSARHLAPRQHAEDLAPYDTIVYCSDSTDLKDIYTLNERCLREGRAFLAATLVAGQAMLGPFVRPGGAPCWFCAQMRLAAQSNAQTRADLWEALLLGAAATAHAAIPALPIARRIGHGLGFELFKLLSGIFPSEVERGVIFQNLDNLEAEYARMAPHPLCPFCSRVDPARAARELETIVRGAKDSNLSGPHIYEAYQPLFDRRLGVFTEFADADMEQLPLKRTRLVSGVEGQRLEATAYALDMPVAAYVPALKEALSQYCARQMDERLAIVASLSEMDQQNRPAISPAKISTWSGAQTLKSEISLAWLPAFSLRRRECVYVPMAAVYPGSHYNSAGLFERKRVGWTTETTFREALTRGILSVLGYEGMCELLRGEATAIALNPDTLEFYDADLDFLLQSIRRFSRPFALLEIATTSPISLVVAHTTDGTAEGVIAVGQGLAGRDALKAALLELVGNLQALQAGESLPAVSTNLLADLIVRGDQIYDTHATSRLYAPAITGRQIEECLLQCGRDILFVTTASADIHEIGALLCGAVLLTREEIPA